MSANLGGTDRILRLLAAAILGILFAADIPGGAIGWLELGLALILALTGIFSFCPMYAFFGISTTK